MNQGLRPLNDAGERFRAVLDAAGDAVLVTDAAGVVTEINAAALRITGRRREETVGGRLLDLAMAAGARDEELEGIRAALAGAPTTYPAHRPRATVTVTATPLPGGGATFVSQGVAAYRDADSRAARASLLAASARALGSLDSLDDTLDALADLLVPAWADSCMCLVIEPKGEVRVTSVRHPDQRVCAALCDAVPASTGPALAGGLLERVVTERVPILIDDFEAVPGRSADYLRAFGARAVMFAPLLAGDELVGIIAASVLEGTGRTFSPADLELLAMVADRAAQGIHAFRLRAAMRAAEGRFRAAFESAPIGIALARPGAARAPIFVEVNPAFCMIAGYPRESLLGRRLDEFTHPEDRPGERRRLDWLLDRRAEEVSGEKRMVRPDGEVRWVLARSAPLEDGMIVSQVQDVTDRRRFESELEHLASHDTLTGLLNRRRLEEAVDQALAHVRRHGDGAAVVTIDVDNFKHVNDTYGHAVGDAVLRAVAGVLRARTRATDQVGRLGGDEFGVVLTRTNAEAARTVGEELLRAVREIRVGVGERDVRVTASIGVRALSPEEARDAGELLGEADMAMYDAKERGRDRISVIRPGDLQPVRVRERMRWSERIRDALETGTGFVLYEQPIMRLSDGVVDRTELLIRMRDEAGAIVEPAHFLGIAERYGLIHAVDRWVVGEAVRMLAERGPDANALEVNLSGDTVSDPSMIDRMVAEIERSGIDPAKLIFEVTETAAIGSLEQARDLATRLTQLGCGFALDDFGAGFGTFAYLKHLPITTIKLDGQFIRNLWDSKADQVTVRAMVDIARGLGKETVAEFVEDEGTLQLLARFGVDRAQGFHIGRPGPAGAIPAAVAS